MKIMTIVVFCCLATLSFAQQKTGIVVDDGSDINIATIYVNWDVPPEDCESELYRWDGETLRCATVDRLGILKMQRNHNMRALTTCRQEVTYLRAARLLEALHVNARAKCRQQGKIFDEDEVLCTDSIGKGEQK